MKIGKEEEEEYTFVIEEDNIFTVSQTVASILGETSDDEGNIDEDKFYYLSDGPTLVIDGGFYTIGEVAVLKKEKIKEMSSRFIESLNAKYNNLLDFNYVLVTGGTGARYYEHLKEYYVGKGIVEEDRLILTNNILNGKRSDIEYAIAAGAYKGLKGKVAVLVEQ